MQLVQNEKLAALWNKPIGIRYSLFCLDALHIHKYVV